MNAITKFRKPNYQQEAAPAVETGHYVTKDQRQCVA